MCLLWTVLGLVKVLRAVGSARLSHLQNEKLTHVARNGPPRKNNGGSEAPRSTATGKQTVRYRVSSQKQPFVFRSTGLDWAKCSPTARTQDVGSRRCAWGGVPLAWTPAQAPPPASLAPGQHVVPEPALPIP